MTKKKEVKLSPEMQACVDIYNAYDYKSVLQMSAVIVKAWKVGKKNG